MVGPPSESLSRSWLSWHPHCVSDVTIKIWPGLIENENSSLARDFVQPNAQVQGPQGYERLFQSTWASSRTTQKGLSYSRPKDDVLFVQSECQCYSMQNWLSIIFTLPSRVPVGKVDPEINGFLEMCYGLRDGTSLSASHLSRLIDCIRRSLKKTYGCCARPSLLFKLM